MKKIKILLILVITIVINGCSSYPNKATSEDKASDLSSREDSYYKSGDNKQEVNLVKKDAEKGLPKAQYNLAFMYYNGEGVKKDYKQAVNWFKKAAEQGYSNAQFGLASMYNSGRGVKKDYKQAVNWFKKAAEQGLQEAQYNLAVMYGAGQGV